MKTEKFYDFRKKLLTIHETDIRDIKRTKKANEYMFEDITEIEKGTRNLSQKR